MLSKNDIERRLKANPHPKIVILTGAGISAESGIKTFRDNNGLWENHSVEEVATPEGFAANPALVYRFYNERRGQLLSGEVHPNIAHTALAELEAALGDNCIVVTQNVDNLHERAGTQNLLHMHGALTWAKCVNSHQRLDWLDDLNSEHKCTCCQPQHAMRPDIVWFGEIPYYMDNIQQHLYEADIFVSIGTSGNVYPAAGFADFANQSGAYTIELNLEPSNGVSMFDESHCGLASELVPRFVKKIVSLT